jgi:hypothetical protein
MALHSWSLPSSTFLSCHILSPSHLPTDATSLLVYRYPKMATIHAAIKGLLTT